MPVYVYRIVGKIGGEKGWQIHFFWVFGESIDQPKDYCTNVNGFSLAYHGWFTKIFCYMVYCIAGFSSKAGWYTDIKLIWRYFVCTGIDIEVIYFNNGKPVYCKIPGYR